MIELHSKEMCEDLFKHGIPRKDKSYKAKPLNLPSDLMQSFWLGLYDADGGISKKSDKSINLELTGTKEICKGFSKFMGFKGGYVYKRKESDVYRFKKGISRLKDLLSIYKKLYYSIGFYLPRKKIKLEKFIEMRRRYKSNRN